MYAQNYWEGLINSSNVFVCPVWTTVLLVQLKGQWLHTVSSASSGMCLCLVGMKGEELFARLWQMNYGRSCQMLVEVLGWSLGMLQLDVLKLGSRNWGCSKVQGGWCCHSGLTLEIHYKTIHCWCPMVPRLYLSDACANHTELNYKFIQWINYSILCLFTIYISPCFYLFVS